MTVPVVAGITVEELEERLPPSPLTAEMIVRDLEAQGLAEEDEGGGWRLTRAGWKVGRGLLDAGPTEAA